MLRKTRNANRFVAEINVVPYIDVMLVLLVIFMVTAPLLQQGVAVELPQASAKSLSKQSKEPIVVSVDKAGLTFLNVADAPNTPVANDALILRVSAELSRDPKRNVLVKGDREASYDKVMSAMVLLQQAGASSVGLITQDVSQSSQKG